MKKIISIIVILMLILLTGCNSSIYTVNFIVNGEIISSQEVKHGDDAVAPSVPELEGHIFKEWDKNYKNVKGNMDITAVFDKEEYIVIFYDEDDNILKEETVKYGEKAIAPSVPEKEGYNFVGWDQDIENVTGDIETYPMYALKKFNVVFKDEDGNILKEQSVEYGKRPVVPQAPEKLGYRFTGWDQDYKNITSDLEIKPTYELETYKITYKDENGNQIKGLTPSSYTILDDPSLELPALIEKEGYECLGWYEGITRVVTFFTSDAEHKVFQLKYKELPKPMAIPDDCTFMFKNIKKVAHSSGNGTFVYQPDFTGLSVQLGVSNWEWSSLHPDVATISQFSSISPASSGFAIIKAVNKENKNIVGYAVIKVGADGVTISSIEEATTKVEFTVTFTDDTGKIIDTQIVEQYKSAVLPTPPIKEGYTFIGWSGEHYNITENITLEARYTKGTSDFVGKTVSILGDSISTYKGYVPDGYSCFYPYPTADLGDVNQTWWMQTINGLGMQLLKNNSFSGTCVATGTYGTTQDIRLKELLDGNTAPDIIIIFMGANDCGSQYVSLQSFTTMYKVMIEKIQKLCPDSEIFIMTLPPSKLYKESDRIEYNKVIVNYAEEFKLPLVNMDNTYNGEDCSKYLVDSAHQNYAGMTKIANCLMMELLKLKGVETEYITNWD